MCCFCMPYLGWWDVYVNVASHFLKAQSNNRTFAQKRNPKQFHREDTTLMLENVTHHLLGCLKENNPKKTVWINYNYTINSWALNFWTKKKEKGVSHAIGIQISQKGSSLLGHWKLCWTAWRLFCAARRGVASNIHSGEVSRCFHGKSREWKLVSKWMGYTFHGKIPLESPI